MNIVNKKLNISDFANYLQTVSFTSWKPTGVTVHHTWNPNLTNRPSGLNAAHILNLKAYYESLKWSSGPHIFVDDNGVWLFSPLTQKGTHAKSFNSTTIGIEMLGNFDIEDPYSGRGAKVTANALQVVRLLQQKLGFKDDRILFHRDDKLTDKSCPGKLLTKSKFLNQSNGGAIVGLFAIAATFFF